MSSVMAYILVRLMVALMVLECILAIFLPSRAVGSTQIHVSQKPFSAVLWTAFVTGSEGEKIEEKADKIFSVQLADLKENFYYLARIHANPKQLILFYHHHDHPPSFLAFLCILII